MVFSIVASVVFVAWASAPTSARDANPLPPRNGFGESDARLVVLPSRVFKAVDAGTQPLESWFFALSVRSTVAALDPIRLVITVRSGERVLEEQVLLHEALASTKQRTLADEVFSIPVMASRPRAWNADRVEVALDVASGDGVKTLKADVPLREYVQTTKLIFPFRGTGLVTQGPFNDRGHTGPSNHFAIDVIGLTENCAPQVNGEESNEAYAGWKRPILAPASGVVTRARDDVPNNPRPGESVDPAVIAALPNPEPQFTIPGNHVVIDHGNSEYSVLMHLDFDSVPVKAGDHVEQGELIGRLGNSGDSFAPHLHYALMSGPELFVADPLPVVFANLPGKRWMRGTYFDAK